MNRPRGLKVCFLTLGCKVNQTESEGLAGLLSRKGYRIVGREEDPDIIILNTCTVTGTGSGKSRKLIRKTVREHPSGTIVVMGCYPQVMPREAAGIEGVDLIVGTQDRTSILQYLDTLNKPGAPRRTEQDPNSGRREPVERIRSFAPNTPFEDLPLIEKENRSRALLKIQDGCNQFCTYCIVPYARGPSRSRSPETSLEEAGKLIEAGYKEIVLTGIHIGAYGKDLKLKIDLAGLVERLAKLPGLKRLRLGSIEPMEFNPALIDAISSYPQICPHFHIPLQSGSDRILAIMNRPYTTKDYACLLAQIRTRLPDAAVTTDIMTGFPGETEQDHCQGLKFLEECAFAGIHVFPFSRRPGTPASEMPGQISKTVKEKRVKDLLSLSEISRKKYAYHFSGKTMEVLLEKIEPDGTGHGHTANYLEVSIPAGLNPGNWKAGEIIECELRQEYIL